MTTIKRWLTSPFFKDMAERVVRAYAGAALLVITAHGTGVIDLSFWKSVVLAGVVPAVSVVFSILSTFRSGPSAGPASLLPATDECVTVVDTSKVAESRHVHGGHNVYKRRIPERHVPGKPLGRNVHHDARSLNFLVHADGTAATVRWDRTIPVLDQGSLGSCTGNAATGALGTAPDYAALPTGHPTLNETFAVSLYSAAEKIDGGAGYPPEDSGSSGLSVAKAAKNLGLINGYTHITSIAAAKTAIQTGPFIVGSNWYTGMDTPSSSGLVTATGTVRGGHEYECIGYNADEDLWELVNSWGTSYGVAGHFFYTSATFTKLLSEQGDATVLQPLGAAPFPTPTPQPAPVATSVAVTDPALVAKITELAGKDKTTPALYLAARLRSLWKVS